MIKILHSADWHLGAPLLLRDPEQAARLRQAQAELPRLITGICQREGCQLLLLSGDLFDGACGRDTVLSVIQALEEVRIPVFISPGNHDSVTSQSPWETELWPGNVHIFRQPEISSVAIPELNCRIYGAGYRQMDCPGLLDSFQAQQEETYAIGVLHGDPTQISSPYCPITAPQVAQSGFSYLALGHIHKTGAFRAGGTLCAWPGCPMGRGYDEQGEKGVLLVTLGEDAQYRFLPLDMPRFFDLHTPAGEDPMQAVSALLPPAGSEDFYRITLTGPCEPFDPELLAAQFPQVPQLVLRDKTTPPVDLWGSAGEDTFEGRYFRLLQGALTDADEDSQRIIRLAATLSRQILDGQEVVLP